jgi:hypothetical protein
MGRARTAVEGFSEAVPARVRTTSVFPSWSVALVNAKVPSASVPEYRFGPPRPDGCRMSVCAEFGLTNVIPAGHPMPHSTDSHGIESKIERKSRRRPRVISREPSAEMKALRPRNEPG